MPLNIEPIDRNQRTAFQEREALRNKVNEIIETVGPMEITWDAVPTTGHGVGYAVTSEGIKASVDNEATSRANQDTALGTRISGEETARANQDTALGTRISGEETARANQDTALQTAIDTEQGTRASEDVSIRGDIAAMGTRITTEESNRANQDTALGTRIDGKQNALTQGAGIQITNDVISATGISVTPGTGIQIIDGVISQSNTRDYIHMPILTATFFSNLHTLLTNPTPFTLMMHSNTASPIGSLTYLSFVGSKVQSHQCLGTGYLLHDGIGYLIFELMSLDTQDDYIGITCCSLQDGQMKDLSFSKSDLSQQNLTGFYNIGTV